jgi:membrane-associated protein
MEFLKNVIDFFLHLDKHLAEIVQSYGTFTYFILFAVIFCETGLVVTPLLPGDSLLFAVGTLTATGVLTLNIVLTYLLLMGAALLGDNCNYWIGRYFGPNVFGRFMNKKYLDRTHEFYEKHGVLTLVIAQFVPIIRTFAPFVAGVGDMTYGKFLRFNFIGVFLWSTLFIWAGYFFGNLEFVKTNFHYVILAIIVVSVLPIVYEVGKQFFGKPAPSPKKKTKKR